MATITWNNSSGGNWNTASDWTPNQVPGAGDDAEIVAIGTYTVTITSNVAIGTLTTAPGATLAISDGDTLTWTTGSTITNDGTIALDSTGSPTKISLSGAQGGTITLDGSGALVLGNNANNAIEADQFSLTFVNNSTIEGSGGIGTNVNLNLDNTGTIDANQSTPLILQPSLNNSSPTANTGTLEATNGGTLQLEGIITNTGGLIQATGTNSVVSLTNGVSVTDGTLTSSSGGVIQSVSGALSGTPTITTGSTISVPDGDTLTLNTGSTITNNGTIALNSAGTKTRISLAGTNGGTITLDGSGVVVLGNNANNAIEADQFSLTFVNNSTIEGSGGIGTNVNVNLDNTGTIDANRSTPLILQPSLNNSSPTTNTGTLEATNGGTLQLEGIITNTGGLIQATGTNSMLSLTNGVSITGGTLLVTGTGATASLNNATIAGATLETALGDTIVAAAGTTATLDTVTLSSGSTYTCADNSQTIVEGTINNLGTIALDSIGTSATLRMLAAQTVTLSGGGTVSLSNQSTNNIGVNAGTGNFINVDNTIAGSGVIQSVTLDNQAKGIIDADQSTPLTIDPGNGFFGVNDTNEGLIEATNGATLTLGPHGSFTQTGTLLATGTGSTVSLNASVVTNDGLFEAANGGWLDVTSAIAGGGRLQIGAGSEIELGGATSETATFTGAANAKLRLGVPGSYTGTIAGFAPGDILELANTNAITATPTLNGANTTLTVNLNGGGTLTYTLAGNLTNDVFPIIHVGSDSDIAITPQLSGQISLGSATEGVALPAGTTVASFTDTNASDTASAFTATINWGDGSTTSGTVSGSNGAFTVSGGHTYADEGSDLLGVTITDTANSTTLPLSGTVTVAEADVLAPQGVSFAPNPGQAFTGTVATFTDSNTANVKDDFTARINWGDGTTTAGVVTDTAGAIAVSGTHSYAGSGQDAVTVTVTDDAPGTATATANSTANVGPQLAGQISLAAATEGVALPGTTTVATFTDTNASETASAFTATINWGDGSTTSGTVSGSNGAFTVTGGHSYADEGSNPLGVTITDTGNNTTLPLNGTVAVAEADALTPQGVSFAANPGQAFTGTVATFTDSDTANVAGDFTGTINWGDGTTTAGVVTDTAGVIAVSGTHSYAGSGQDAVTVTLADDAPGTATATANSTANIGPQLAVQVTLSGTPQEGQTLTANASSNDAQATIHYQWQSSIDGVTFSSIANAADAATYLVQEADEAHEIRAIVTAVDAVTGATASVTSTPTATVIDIAATLSVAVRGTAQEGQTLTAIATGNDSDATISYRWQILTGTIWSNITGATGSTYLVTEADERHQLRVVATSVDPDGSGTTATGTPTVPVIDVTPTISVTESGTAQQGQILTATAHVTSDGDGGVVTYQWQQLVGGNWTPITGASNRTYRVTEANENNEIRVLATFRDDTGQTVSATSLPTAPVVDVTPSLTVTTSGTAQDGRTLTAHAHPTSDGDGGTTTYQWQELVGTTWTNIAGATAPTYQVAETNDGHQLRVAATFTDDTNQAASATSAPTAAVMDLDSPPALTIANHFLTVPAGGSVALPISVASFDADDTVFVVVNHVQPWESVTDNLDHLTFSSPTDVLSAAEVNSGLTLQVSPGAPLTQNALTFTAVNTTAGDTANTGTQALFVTVTDPPASASATAFSPATRGQVFAAASNPVPLNQLMAVFDQFIAAGFHGSQNGSGPITTISPPPTGMEELSFLSSPHH